MGCCFGVLVLECSGVTPGTSQGTKWMLEIQPTIATCKASAHLVILSLQLQECFSFLIFLFFFFLQFSNFSNRTTALEISGVDSRLLCETMIFQTCMVLSDCPAEHRPLIPPTISPGKQDASRLRGGSDQVQQGWRGGTGQTPWCNFPDELERMFLLSSLRERG